MVNFSIAINDSYKPKGADETKKFTTFVECAYWQNNSIVAYLKKGTIVELSGSIRARAYKNMDCEPMATLAFHVNSMKLHGGNKRQAEKVTDTIVSDEEDEVLPF